MKIKTPTRQYINNVTINNFLVNSLKIYSISFSFDKRGINIADTAPVAWQQIVGVYAFHIPYLGYISIYAKTPLGIAVVCGVLIVLILLNFIPDILEEDKKKNLNTPIYH